VRNFGGGFWMMSYEDRSMAGLMMYGSSAALKLRGVELLRWPIIINIIQHYMSGYMQSHSSPLSP